MSSNSCISKVMVDRHFSCHDVETYLSATKHQTAKGFALKVIVVILDYWLMLCILLGTDCESRKGVFLFRQKA